jgi:hypothetical protein
MVFGGRQNRPASKLAVLIAGAFMTALGALFCLAMLFGERAPDVPAIAILVAILLALGGLAAGIFLLITGLRMPERPPIERR